MADPIYDDLNEEQRAAVEHGEGPLMVLAGAGSGKTRVVTRRIARLLRTGVRSGQILAMTFTNKAAGEMARRVEQLGGEFVRIATFHSACARFLRVEAGKLGFPSDFSIYDTYDRDQLLRSLIEERGLDRTKVKASAVGQVISRMKNAAMKPGEAVFGTDDVGRVVEAVYGPYLDRMRAAGAMDFDDLLLHFLTLLREFPETAERYRERYPWVLVDEFQDTNRVQYDLLRQLAPPTANVCVVGDPDQSIYKFRGAEVRNLLDFEDDWPGTKVVRLEQNYRSSANILRAAETVIANNRLRKDKRLRTDAEPGEPILQFKAGGPAEEAQAIADRVRELAGGGVPYDEVAVFYRAHWLSRSLEQALKDHGIPYVIVGGLTFFERREIKDLLAYLRVLVNPLDEVSAERILNVPPRGLGKTTLGRLRAAATAAGMSLREAIAAPELHGELTARARKGLQELASVLAEAQEAAKRSAQAALHVVLARTGYIAYATGFGDPEDGTREENIAELVSDVVEFDTKVGEGLAGYLQHVALLTSADTQGDGPAISLMTVHAAKGLEFDHVFVAGLEEGVFPSMRSAVDQDDLEEERRLMYVAITRARKSLFLSSARERMVGGSMEHMKPSRFLKELPPEVLENFAASWRRYDADDRGALSTGWSVTPDPEALASLRAGTRVSHDLYGSGTVRRIAGRGLNTRAVVRFDDGVEREFVLEYAGLKLLEDSSW